MLLKVNIIKIYGGNTMNFQNIKNFMDRLTAELVPGNVLCMYIRGQEVFRYASGYADMENRIPMTGSELLNI